MGITYYIVEKGIPKLGANVISAMFIEGKLVSFMYIMSSIEALMSHTAMLMILHGAPDTKDDDLLEWKGANTRIQSAPNNKGILYISEKAADDLIERLDKEAQTPREQKKEMKERVQPNKDALGV